MKYLLCLIVAIFVILLFYSKCNSEFLSQSDTGPADHSVANTKTLSGDTEPQETEFKSARGAFIDSLDKVYSDFGFSSFCVIQADLDSIFLVSDFMAGALIGADNFSQERTRITLRIEKEKVREYYKQHGIPRKKVSDDLMQLAMKYPSPCQRYSDYRYDEYKRKIHNELSFDLHVEAHKKYFDLK